MVRYAALAALALNLGVLGMALPKDRPRRQSSGSNVLVIMTDDQGTASDEPIVSNNQLKPYRPAAGLCVSDATGEEPDWK